MKVNLEVRGLTELERRIASWSVQVSREMTKLFRELGFKWRAEAVRRVPVETGWLKSKILQSTYLDTDNVWVTDVGTNVRDQETGFIYPMAVEFGTRYIAGGAVKALGDSPLITDAQAIHTWPAKSRNGIAGTSVGVDTDGATRGRRRDALGRFTGIQEQMPWLRTSWTSGVFNWFIARYNRALEPARQEAARRSR